MRHGGDLGEARRRFGADLDWLDLSTGINPHPWPVAADALALPVWTRLPSADDLDALLATARRTYAVPNALAVAAAPGTQALIQWLPHLAPPGDVAILGPTYAEHGASWREGNRTVTFIRDTGEIPLSARHLVVVNPNNPDGRILPLPPLVAAAERCADRGGWLVIDESFVDTVPDASAIGRTGALPVIVLRSFGKFYGVAGLRLGFAVGPPEIVDRLAHRLGPWAMSGPALAIGRSALDDRVWAGAMRVRLADDARALDAALSRGDARVVGGTSLFRLVRHRDAARLHDGLARRGIWVRAFDWADELIRVGLPPDPAALERVAAAWRDLA